MTETIKNKKRESPASRDTSLRLLLRLFVVWLHNTQIRIAQSLQVTFERLSPWAKNISLVLFFLAGMATFTSIIASSIRIRSPVEGQVYLIRFPKSRIIKKESKDLPIYTSNPPDQKRVTHFQKYMDSLSQSNSGRLIRDSIMKARPGLIDSLTRLENLLHSTNDK